MGVQWPADDQKITHLPQHSSFNARLADLLRQVSSFHRATDPPLGQEPGSRGGEVAQERVVEIPMTCGQVFLGLRCQQERQVTPRPQHGKGSPGELVQEYDPLVQRCEAMLRREYLLASMV